MPTSRGLWEVAVLSLLREKPMHPYEMQRLLRERHKGDLLSLKKGSLYHAISRLLAAAFIEPVEIERNGRRPERTIYRITASGRQELLRELRQRLSTPRQETPDLMGSISFLVYLTPEDAITRLGERVRGLEDEVRRLEVRIASASLLVERVHVIENEYLVAMRRAELQWVRDLLDELRSGRFTWDLRNILKEVRAAASAEKLAGEKEPQK